jgi:pyruvate-ferredoxin/flavodoxin oxidoreductase
MAKKDKDKPREPAVPERGATARSALYDAIRPRALAPREISRRTGLSEKALPDHLEHLGKSLHRSGERLAVHPAECLACGFVFEGRGRLTTPSRCPTCKSERVSPPSFGIEGRRADGAHAAEPAPGLDPAPRTRDDGEAMAAGSTTLRDVLQQAEIAAGAVVFATANAGGDQASGAGALGSAVDAAREGRRAAVVLTAGELLASLGALHAAARERAPILVHVLGDHDASTVRLGRDEIAPALDVGAGVVVTWSAQESVDLTLAARRAAEDAETPFVLVSDGGGLVMSMPGAGLVEKFLGAKRADGSRNGEGSAVDWKRRERGFAARAPFALAGAMRELGELTGRALGPVERYETADAEEIVVAVGQGFAAARAAAEALRAEGRRVGAVGVRVLRPFFASDLVKAVGRARAVAVIEPLDVALAPAGPLATSLKAAFADALTWAPGFPGVGHIPTVVSVVFATITGTVTAAEVRAALVELGSGDRAKRLIVLGSES